MVWCIHLVCLLTSDLKNKMIMGAETRVLFSCTGIGLFNRGIESFFREAYDGLKHMDGVQTKLLTGVDTQNLGEQKVWCLPRTTRLAEMMGKVTGRNAYTIEQLSSFPAIINQIKTFKPHVIYSSEANLFYLLYRLRPYIKVPFKLLYSNGGPMDPPFVRLDYIHQVAPYYRQVALDAGEAEQKHIMVPYGIHVPEGDFFISEEDKKALRRKLDLPEGKKILISVGWISAGHKRMDYTINEVAALPKEQRPFLLLLGNIDAASPEIIELARQKLEPEAYAIRSVPYKEVVDYYKVSDLFVLSSLREGFGRVYLEALMYNLPVIAHHHPVMQYVVGDAGYLLDLEKNGVLSAAISRLLNEQPAPVNRREYVRQKFDWNVLKPKYKAMFEQVASAKQ